MSAAYNLRRDLIAEVAIPANGIVSITLQEEPRSKVVLFGFAAGQELSDHTASVPAVVHILSGEATVKLGDDVYDLGPHGWVYMPAHLVHAVRAKTDVVMLLTMLRGGA